MKKKKKVVLSFVCKIIEVYKKFHVYSFFVIFLCFDQSDEKLENT